MSGPPRALICLLLLIGFLPAAAAAGQDPLVPKGDVDAVSTARPRMLLTPASLAALQTRLRTDPVSRKLFDQMKTRCDGMLRMEARLDNQGRHYLPSYALLHAVTGEERYARMAAKWLLRMADETIENPWTCLEYVPTAAFAFDWVHGSLTADERLRAGRGLLRQLDRVKKLWRHSDYNNHFLLEHMGQLHVALALAHEPGFEKTAAKLFAEAEIWLKRHALPASNETAGGEAGDRAGGHCEGFSYNNWGYARPLGRLLAAWKSATGEDLFPRSVLLEHDAIWNAFGRLPDGTMVRLEDCPSGLTWGQGTRSTFELVAREYRDGIARTLADSIPCRYPQVVWPILIFRDPKVRAAPLTDLPRARLFEGIGHVYSHSAFGDPGAVVTTFQCGPFMAGHQHLDNNAFTIFFRARLALDSGVNEYSSHRANYYSRSVAHNTVTVLDPNETFPKATWSHEGDGGSNDGGQRRVPFPGRATAPAAEKAAREVGRIVHFEADEDYCYAVGDATRSYGKGKVKRFVRHFLHRYPDLVIVYDEVVTGDSSFETRWLLHTSARPEVGEDEIVAASGGGALVVRLLLPAPKERKVRVIGGPGREYFAGGRNHPPDAKTDPNAGAWRIEVVDTARRTRRTFLHALLALPAKGRAEEAKRWTFDVKKTGARVEIGIRRTTGGGRPAIRETWRQDGDGWLRRR
ncbi:MAG: heparinase II/III family protein [Planctomycetota bacterium]